MRVKYFSGTNKAEFWNIILIQATKQLLVQELGTLGSGSRREEYGWSFSDDKAN